VYNTSVESTDCDSQSLQTFYGVRYICVRIERFDYLGNQTDSNCESKCTTSVPH